MTAKTTANPALRARNAHYHPVKTTAQWAAFVAALEAAVHNSADRRAREVAQRKRETTYARGTTGGS